MLNALEALVVGGRAQGGHSGIGLGFLRGGWGNWFIRSHSNALIDATSPHGEKRSVTKSLTAKFCREHEEGTEIGGAGWSGQG